LNKFVSGVNPTSFGMKLYSSKDELIGVHTEQTEEQKIVLKCAKDDMLEYKTEL
jgi:hypothetical protein